MRGGGGGEMESRERGDVLVRGGGGGGRELKVGRVRRERAGAVEGLVEVIAAARASSCAVRDDRTSRDVAMNEADIEIDIETRGHDHIDEVLDALEDAGYQVEVLA